MYIALYREALLSKTAIQEKEEGEVDDDNLEEASNNGSSKFEL